MEPARKYIQSQLKSIGNKQRGARYIFVLTGAVFIYLAAYLLAISNDPVNSLERPIFEAVNQLPAVLYPVFYIFTQFGSISTLILWVAAGWYLVNRRTAATVLCASVAAWLLTIVAKASVHRGRPGVLLDNVHLFSGEKFSGFGFPSGHSTFSAACATVLYYQVAPEYRKYLIGIVFLVGLSRMFLGAHFPLDVVGGWAFGTAIGAFTVLLLGISKPNISVAKLKKYLGKRS